jgi:hypothetical protein
MKQAFLILLALLTTQCQATIGSEDAFWTWFQQHEAAYYALDPTNVPQREALFDALSIELTRVNPELSFEFGPVIDGRRDFVVSAGGAQEAFPAVRGLVSHAPTLSRWRVVAFRPRRYPVSTIQFQDVSLDPKDVLVQLSRDGDKVGLTVFMDGYTKQRNTEFGQAAFLLLDEALGEFDVETKVGFIEFMSLPQTIPSGAVPMSDLASTFDKLYGP